MSLLLNLLFLDVKPNNAAPYFPGTLTINDVEAACDATPFPTLTQNPAVTSVAPVYVLFYSLFSSPNGFSNAISLVPIHKCAKTCERI